MMSVATMFLAKTIKFNEGFQSCLFSNQRLVEGGNIFLYENSVFLDFFQGELKDDVLFL